jgi:outer membrane protein OmpA-like peptidoglycan-associated protein
VENGIEAELGHPGLRRNSFGVLTGRGKSQKMVEIEDRETHFQVWDSSFGSKSKGTVSNARRVGRVKVGNYKIDGFSAGSDSLPSTSAGVLAALAAEMKNTPTASAFLEGFASGGKSADADARIAEFRAFEVRDAVIKQANDKVNVSWKRFDQVGKHDASRNSVIVTLARPDI